MKTLEQTPKMIDTDVPKYKKKKESSISKSRTKSKHKHQYKECLLIHQGSPHRAKYCMICGKIGNVKFQETEKLEAGYYRALSDDEIYEKYKNLERIHILDIFQKYISIQKEE